MQATPLRRLATLLLPFLALMVLAAVAGLLLLPSSASAQTPGTLGPAASAAAKCSSDGAVPDSAANPGLVQDCANLLLSKDILLGRGNDQNLNWASDLPMAQWEGVTVSGDPQRVTQLALLNTTGRALGGSIPGELGNLTNLTMLYLWNNELTGSIPGELGDLANLNILILGEELTGGIPKELGDLTNLDSLVLSDNELTGSIPEELGNLTKLDYLWLDNNKLSGFVPDGLGNLTDLDDLKLNGNPKLGGCLPDALRNVPSVFVDSGVRWCSDWASALEKCSSDGAVPNPAANPGLVRDCANLLLSRDILLGSGNDRNLNRASDLPITQWVGVTVSGDPQRVTELSLIVLPLADEVLGGSIPGDLGNLTNLTTLNLGANGLTGGIPNKLGNLTNLTTLLLAANELTGSIPEELGDLTNLTILYLGYNGLTGGIPKELANLTNLATLRLEANELTGSIPKELGNLTNLTVLGLGYNGLTGGIPKELGDLTNLSELGLSSNNLSGLIPLELSKLVHLKSLNLHKNANLRGCVPDRIWDVAQVIVDPIVKRCSEVGPILYGMAITSRPASGQNDNYKIGDQIVATATFSRAINSMGTPALTIDVGGEYKTANCAVKSGAPARLECIYTVVSGDEDTDGIRVGANRLTGPITSSDGLSAMLTYIAIGPLAGHKVDGVAPAKPTGFTAAATGTSGEVVLNWNDPGDASIAKWQYAEFATDKLVQFGTPLRYALQGEDQIQVSPGSYTLYVPHDSHTFVGPSFHSAPELQSPYLVVEELNDGEWQYRTTVAMPAVGQGRTGYQITPALHISIGRLTTGTHNVHVADLHIAGDSATKLRLSFARDLQDQATWDDATWYEVPGSSATTTKYVVTGLENGQPYIFLVRAVDQAANAVPASEPQEATPGSATSEAVDLAITSSPSLGQNDTYKIGDDIVLAVNSHNQFNVTGTPTLTINVGGEDKTATCAAKPGETTSLECTYTVVVGDEDTDGISVDEGRMVGTFTGNDGALYLLSYPGIAHHTDHKVDGVVPAKPTGFTAVATWHAGQVELKWTDPGDASIARWEYAIDGETSYNNVPESSATTTKHVVTDLENGQSYTFKIRAVDRATNVGAASEPQEATIPKWAGCLDYSDQPITPLDLTSPDGTSTPGFSSGSIVGDCAALMNSKDELRGTASLNWSPRLDMESWEGVTIRNKRVVKLDLANKVLTGIIPAELGDLSALEYLDLGHNALTGGLPDELGNLANLKRLYLDENKLKGNIPAKYANLRSVGPNKELTGLRELNLTGNDLTGTVELKLSRNQVSEGGGTQDVTVTATLDSGSAFAHFYATERYENRYASRLLVAVSGSAAGLLLSPPQDGLTIDPGNIGSRGRVVGFTPVEDFSILFEIDEVTASADFDLAPVNDDEIQNDETITVSAIGIGAMGSANLRLTSNKPTITLTDTTPNNSTPHFSDGVATTRHVDENSAADSAVGSPVSATDPDDDMLTYTITGKDATSFGFDTGTGQIKVKAALDYETPPQNGNYSVRVTVSDGKDADGNADTTVDDTIAVTIIVIDVDETGIGAEITCADGETENCAPDLVVAPPEVSSSSLFTEASFTLRATVRNQGNGPSAPTTLRYYRSTDATISTDDTEVGTGSVPALAADGASNGSIELTAPTNAGTYYYGACVASVAEESDTGNNCSAAVVVTVADPPEVNRPDLIVAPPEVSSSSLFTEASFTLRATVRNQGNGPSAPTTLRYYRSTDATISTDDTEVGTGSVPALAADGASNGSIELTAPTNAGTYYYGACVASVAEESDTGNNCSAAVVVKAVAPSDRLVLLALYNATDGPNWTINTNWLTSEPIGQWHGVTSDDNGRVTELDLKGNQLKGGIPAELGSLSNLSSLWLYDNQLSGGIPSELGDLSNLTQLYLSSNQLSGGIPSELGDLSNLSSLWLYDNQLSGGIPSELGDLSNLRHLLLNHNQLSGEIPSELGDLSNLGHLNLNHNRLSGEIPSELGDLSILTSLWLHDNQLSGEIPSELGDLSILSSLWLHDNQLSGEIPSELGDLSNLTSLWLNGNRLSGCVPAALRDVESNDFGDLRLPFCAPDLAVALPTVSESNPSAGASFTLRATVRNQGNGPSAPTTLRYYRSTDATISTDDTEVGTGSVPALAADGASNGSIELTAPTNAGTYYYGACVASVAEESDTGNNCSGGVMVTVGP